MGSHSPRRVLTTTAHSRAGSDRHCWSKAKCKLSLAAHCLRSSSPHYNMYAASRCGCNYMALTST